jgi:hypothetical protein
MSNIKIAASVRNSMLAAITAAIGASGKLVIYDGTQPANPDTALASNNVLATLPLSATFAAAPAAGVLTASAITTTNASAGGTAAWFSLQTSAGARVYEASIGASGADLNLNTTTIASGTPVAVSSLTITGPGG